MEGAVSSILPFCMTSLKLVVPKLLLNMVLERASWSLAGPGNKSIITSGLTGQVCSATIFIYNIAIYNNIPV